MKFIKLIIVQSFAEKLFLVARNALLHLVLFAPRQPKVFGADVAYGSRPIRGSIVAIFECADPRFVTQVDSHVSV